MSDELCGVPVMPWQQQAVERWLAGKPDASVTMPSGRSGGKVSAQRYAIRATLARDGHIHVGAKDGLWCVTGTGMQLVTFGPLWEKIR